MDPIVNDDDPIGSLEQLVLLLDRASRACDRAADQDDAGSPLGWLGLGALLAQAQVVELIPHRYVIAELDRVEDLLDPTFETVDRRPQDRRSALPLLRAAEQVTRSDALQFADWPGLSTLVVALCDLISEASSGGC